MPDTSENTWALKILDFLQALDIDETLLPKDILPLYPLKGEHRDVTLRVISAFYKKYYSDQKARQLVIGINPGRLGAGATGIPFTDTKRLEGDCGIPLPEISTHEPSSVFIYEMIAAFGGPEEFYRHFYITSVCPIGFVRRQAGGTAVNFNYYDSKKFTSAIEPYICEKLEQQIAFGADTARAYCLGTGKNFAFLNELNQRRKYFGDLVPLEHPRYIMQYKNKSKEAYIDKYLSAFSAEGY